MKYIEWDDFIIQIQYPQGAISFDGEYSQQGTKWDQKLTDFIKYNATSANIHGIFLVTLKEF